MSQILTGVTT